MNLEEYVVECKLVWEGFYYSNPSVPKYKNKEYSTSEIQETMLRMGQECRSFDVNPEEKDRFFLLAQTVNHNWYIIRQALVLNLFCPFIKKK